MARASYGGWRGVAGQERREHSGAGHVDEMRWRCYVARARMQRSNVWRLRNDDAVIRGGPPVIEKETGRVQIMHDFY